MRRIATAPGRDLPAEAAFWLCTALLFGCGRSEQTPVPPALPQAPASTIAQRTVCSNHERIWIPTADSGKWRPVTQLAVPGGATLIPEFHDCQRLVTAGGSEYGPEAGIYAFPGIVSLLDTLRRLELANEPLRAIAAAEILSVGNYDQLGIEIGANCLYMFTVAGRPDAFMRPVGPDEQLCGERLKPLPPQSGWHHLNVTEDPVPAGFTEKDFSASARWDWDDRVGVKKQFIGLPCKASWCLIGHVRPQSWRRYDRPPGHSTRSRRVLVIRGWYDEQRLGVNPTPGSPARLSTTYGTIFPDSLLGDRTETEYRATQWITAAQIKLTSNLPQYKTKFNLDQTPTTGETYNVVSLCMGDATRCGIPSGAPVSKCAAATDPWYALIISAAGDTAYRCVTRHVHAGFDIPGNARWWWTDSDEGIWMRCPQGCCQVT
jgi:hypothetical protein